MKILKFLYEYRRLIAVFIGAMLMSYGAKGIR